MKLRTTLLILMAFVTTYSIGQSFSVLNGVSRVEAHKSNAEDVFHVNFDIQNNSSVDKDVLCKRVVLTGVDSTVNYFCWTQCYGPATDLSPTHYTIPANGATSIFNGYYNPTYWVNEGIAGTAVIRYVFFDMNNPSDSTYYDVEYAAWGGLDQEEENVFAVDEPFPNPAVDETIFEFELPNSSGRYSLNLYDMLGNTVRTDVLDPLENKYILNVSDLKPGIYFYSVDLDGQSLLTRKLIVSGI